MGPVYNSNHGQWMATSDVEALTCIVMQARHVGTAESLQSFPWLSTGSASIRIDSRFHSLRVAVIRRLIDERGGGDPGVRAPRRCDTGTTTLWMRRGTQLVRQT